MPTNQERGIDLLETYAGPYITRLMEAAESGADRPEECPSTWHSDSDRDPQEWTCAREPQHPGLHAAIAIDQTVGGAGFVAVICAIWSDNEALVR